MEASCTGRAVRRREVNEVFGGAKVPRSGRGMAGDILPVCLPDSVYL
jgi:hypothetical protein